MSYQSEAALEQQFMEQLNKQEYSNVDIPDYGALIENFKVQFEAFNASKLDTPITDKEWERIFNLMLGKSVIMGYDFGTFQGRGIMEQNLLPR